MGVLLLPLNLSGWPPQAPIFRAGSKSRRSSFRGGAVDGSSGKVNEIAKHVTEGKFRVHVYNGLRSGERTTAKRLASQHIVITTYDVLTLSDVTR